MEEKGKDRDECSPSGSNLVEQTRVGGLGHGPAPEPHGLGDARRSRREAVHVHREARDAEVDHRGPLHAKQGARRSSTAQGRGANVLHIELG